MVRITVPTTGGSFEVGLPGLRGPRIGPEIEPWRGRAVRAW